MDNSGTQSLKHMALDLAVGKNGTRIREKVWCRECRGRVFATEISRRWQIETYDSERFDGCL